MRVPKGTHRLRQLAIGGVMLAVLLPPGISQAAFGQQVLRYGTADHVDVKVLQLELQRLGYGVTVDGVFGPGTLYAVESFQRAHRLSADGVVGNQTFIALAQASRTSSRGNDPRGSAYTVQSGDTLESIAAKEGVTLSALQEANPSVSATSLQAGQTIVIPSASAVSQLPPPSSFGAKLAALVMNYGGVRYLYGGANPAVGFDCSGLVYYAAHVLGVNLPRTASEQYGVGVPVPAGDLQPGDLVFFNTDGYASHVGIYIGNGQFVQAETTGTVVHLTTLSEPYWANSYIGARRIYN
ncbi:MAG: NlpC/P60 family protein [Thermaerobacter sp.]|nr:NlpC/P60 family protein [Thermaerobacter sp.]